MKTVTMLRTALLSLFILTSAAAMAMDLQEAMSALSSAKEQGLVGEQQNGYLGVVKDRDNASEIVQLINDARRDEYTRIAENNNIAVSDVEALAGKRAIERSSPGHYIQIDDEWVRKR
ncbi:YdbL family protein [Aliidiomarina sp. Khilg15.8]